MSSAISAYFDRNSSLFLSIPLPSMGVGASIWFHTACRFSSLLRYASLLSANSLYTCMVRNELRFRPTLGSDKLLTMTMRRVVKHSTTRSNTATKNPASFCRSVLLKSLLRIFPPAILVKLDDVEDHYSVCQLKIGSNCFHKLLRIVLVKILLDIQAAVCRRDSFYHPHRDLRRARR